jgi:hypothetical protein
MASAHRGRSRRPSRAGRHSRSRALHHSANRSLASDAVWERSSCHRVLRCVRLVGAAHTIQAMPERGATTLGGCPIRKTATTLAMVALFLAAATTARAVPRMPTRCADAFAPRLCSIHWHHKRANQYRLRLGMSKLPYKWMAERHPARRDYFLARWQRVHVRWKRAWHDRPRDPWSSSWYSGALCVHSKEGAWNDPNAPYYGGMQMDMSFQQAYGPEFLRAYGTADHWPAHDQLVAAYRAWKSRGWSPWPVTSAMCGL